MNTPPHRLNLTAVSRRPKPRFVEIAEVVPEPTLLEWAANLYTLMNLAWDYVETVLDVVIQMRVTETKPLVRQIRQLKREYDQFRSRCIDNRHERNERELAENYEDYVQKHLGKLYNALDFEASRMGLDRTYRPLFVAVHQCMTVLEAVSIYARKCDTKIREMGVAVSDRCMVQKEFLPLYTLIPQFAGDCYLKDLGAVRLTAGILVNELERIQINIYWNDEQRGT